MAYETIIVEKKEKTKIVSLNRPDKLNAINAQMLKEISQVLAELREDTNTRFVILKGEGQFAASRLPAVLHHRRSILSCQGREHAKLRHPAHQLSPSL